MEFGIAIGTIVANIKDPALAGCLMLVVQPITQLAEKKGDPIVVVDADRNTGIGDVIIFVHSPDASMVLPGDLLAPIDAAVTAIVDHVDIGKDATMKTGEQWRLAKLLEQLQLP